MSDYSRYGYAYAKHTNAAGEDIRYLRREIAQQAGLPDCDFWLFDSNRVLRLNFNDADTLLNCEFIDDPAEIVQHNHWRDVAWHHAVRRDEFATEEHIGRT